MTIELEDSSHGVSTGLYKPEAFIVQAGQSHLLDVREVTNSNDVLAKQLRFVATGPVQDTEGVGVIAFRIEDAFQPSQAFYVFRTLN